MVPVVFTLNWLSYVLGTFFYWSRKNRLGFSSISSNPLFVFESSHLTVLISCLPLPELLSQLSGVRRSAGGQLNSSGPSASQLQQLQMQLQLERQQAQAARQQLETARNATRRSNPSNISATIPPPSTATNQAVAESNPMASHSSQFLLAR